MRLDRYTVGALAGVVALAVGGGTAFAGKSGGDKTSRCQERLARIAERRGTTVEQLQADIKAKLLARVDAALQAAKVTSDQAAKLRERISDAAFCSGRLANTIRHGVGKMLAAAADYLGLTKSELRDQLHGTSLAALAAKQGKSVADLEAAMLSPAKERLAKAVSAGSITQAQADRRLERLEQLVARLVSKTFPAKS
jgi:hypothetical protein